MKKRLFAIALFGATILSFNVSCSDDFVDRKFYQDVEQAPLTNLQEMQAFIRGAYSYMRGATYYGADFLAFGEIRSDIMYSNKMGGYYTDVQDYTMISTSSYASGTWNQIYKMIATTNIAINTDVTAFTGTDLDKSKARFSQGQAYALRAQGFFDLLRLYGQKYTGGDLGIVLPLEYNPAAKMPRATVAETEIQIERDFEKALEIMSNNESTIDASTKKTELSIPALKALMSRFYLYKGDYAKVKQLTSEIISSGEFDVAPVGLLEVTYSDIMNGAAPNSIFELAVGQPAALGTSSYAYRLNPDGYANLQVQESVLPTLFQANDARLSLVDSDGFVAGKYTNLSGYDNIKVVRYEEVLLNAIEAELQVGSPAKALEYYKTLLSQRLLAIKNSEGVVISSVEEQLAAITSVTLADLKQERARELLGEGFRQWDLLRWGDTSFKPAAVNANLLAFPIPRAEINISGTAIVQNPGYEL